MLLYVHRVSLKACLSFVCWVWGSSATRHVPCCCHDWAAPAAHHHRWAATRTSSLSGQPRFWHWATPLAGWRSCLEARTPTATSCRGAWSKCTGLALRWAPCSRYVHCMWSWPDSVSRHVYTHAHPCDTVLRARCWMCAELQPNGPGAATQHSTLTRCTASTLILTYIRSTPLLRQDDLLVC
jgi:hypothetical protein